MTCTARPEGRGQASGAQPAQLLRPSQRAAGVASALTAAAFDLNPSCTQRHSQQLPPSFRFPGGQSPCPRSLPLRAPGALSDDNTWAFAGPPGPMGSWPPPPGADGIHRGGHNSQLSAAHPGRRLLAPNALCLISRAEQGPCPLPQRCGRNGRWCELQVQAHFRGFPLEHSIAPLRCSRTHTLEIKVEAAWT